MNLLQALNALLVHSSGTGSTRDASNLDDRVNHVKSWLLSVDIAEWTRSWPLDQQQQQRLARILVSLPDRIANTYEGNPPPFFTFQQFFTLLTTKLNDALSRHSAATDTQRYAMLLDNASRIGASPFIAQALCSLRSSLCCGWSSVLALYPNGIDIASATLVQVSCIERIPTHDITTLCLTLFGQFDSPLVADALSTTSILMLPWHARAAFVCYLDSIESTVVALVQWLQLWSKHDIHSWASQALKDSLTESLLLAAGALQGRIRASKKRPLPFDPVQSASFLVRGMPLWLGSCEKDRISAQVVAEELYKLIPDAEVLSFDLPPHDAVLWLRKCVEAGHSLADATDLNAQSQTISNLSSRVGSVTRSSIISTAPAVPTSLLDSDDDEDSAPGASFPHLEADIASNITTAAPSFLSECIQVLNANNSHSPSADIGGAVGSSALDVQKVVSHLPQIIRASPQWVVDDVAPSLAGELLLRLQSVHEEADIESTTHAFFQLVAASPAGSLRSLVENLNSDGHYNDMQMLLVLGLIGQSCAVLANAPQTLDTPAGPNQLAAAVYRIGTIKRESVSSTRVSTHNRMGQIAHFVLAALLGVSHPDRSTAVFNRRLWAIAQVLSNSYHLVEFASLAADSWEWLLTLSATCTNSDTRLAALTVFLATTSLLEPHTASSDALDPLFSLVAHLAADWGQVASDKALQTASFVLVNELGRLRGRRT
ncbi:hypothetical protein BCR44DRAFT_213100 [Catenaria anguillulae PL171]|uniref:Uncharacterized protein n=1 Tax=Catenaria anguillulae PL171 TaxID=765915 RepID=A0A1Y2HK88_9FUNG|nr:hypothetical protein BCR44DRAFT_213100 [Catenaria anguillulae PL171]